MTATSLSNSAGLKLISWKAQSDEIQVGDIITVVKNMVDGERFLPAGYEAEIVEIVPNDSAYYTDSQDYDDRYGIMVNGEIWYLFFHEIIRRDNFKQSWQVQKDRHRDSLEKELQRLEERYKKWVDKLDTITDNHKQREVAIRIKDRIKYEIERLQQQIVNLDKKRNIWSSLKFSSDDLSFDDYDTNDKDRKRNDFFVYEKDALESTDALDDQQSYHTDKMYLEDTQRTQKERDAFDWTGRENLQFGFGSLKFAWQVHKDIPIMGKIKYKILSLIGNSPEGVGSITDIAPLFDYNVGGKKYHYFQQLRKQKYIEDAGVGGYKLSDKGVEALENLDFQRNGSLKFAWQVQKEIYSFEDLLKVLGPNQVWEALNSTNELAYFHTGPKVIIKFVSGVGVELASGIWTSSIEDPPINKIEGDCSILKQEGPFELMLGIPKESSLKFSEEYFDSSPAESNPIEESKLVNPIDDKHLRRTNPKRFDERHDRYKETDSDISNRYDNAIQGDASLKFAWQQHIDIDYWLQYEGGDSWFADPHQAAVEGKAYWDSMSDVPVPERYIPQIEQFAEEFIEEHGYIERNIILAYISQETTEHLEASQKLSWQIQEPLYALYDTETGELYANGDIELIKNYWWNILKHSIDVGGHVLDISNPDNPHIYENMGGEIMYMAATEELLKEKWWAYLKYHEEEGGYGLTTTDKFNEEINSPPPHRASKIAWQIHSDPKPKLPPVGTKVEAIKDWDWGNEGDKGKIVRHKGFDKGIVLWDDGGSVGVHRDTFYKYFKVIDTSTTQESSSNSAGLKIFSWAKEG